jgi:alkylation response protein AidB-like acyl-CoA dehydrogenase
VTGVAQPARELAESDPVAVAPALTAAIAERADGYDRDAAFPVADVDDLRAVGLLGLLVPRALGGWGAGFLDYVRVAVALSRASGATGLVFNMHAAVTGSLAGVPDELARGMGAPDSFFTARDGWLADAAGGALYGVAITEREAGSRLQALRTTFARDGDGYRIRGHKSVCTGAGHLDAYLVAARAADADDGDDPRISYFLVPAGDGIEVDRTWDPLGMRATASNGLSLDVHVPATALVGGIEGTAVLLAYLMPQWLTASYAACYVGVAEAALAAAADHVGARTVSPTADRRAERGGLGRLGAVRARLGRADAQVAAARLALEEAGRRVDTAPGEPETNRWIYRAKLLAGDAAQEVAASCAEACGLAALRRGSPLERLLRDARSGALMPPASDVCADVLGTAVLGLDPLHGSDLKPW